MTMKEDKFMSLIDEYGIFKSVVLAYALIEVFFKESKRKLSSRSQR